MGLICSATIGATDAKRPKSCGLPIFDAPKERALYYKNREWKPGQVIKVYFLNGTEIERGAVEHYAREWEKYGNFKFEFHQERKTQKEHTVLIKFEAQRPGVAGWSSLGRGTESIEHNSMSFAVGTRHEGTILHEFGHTLGFGHEQDSPGGAADWIPEAAYKYFREHYKWDRKKVDEEIFNKVSDASVDWTAFDHESTMAYGLPGELFKSGRPLGSGSFLSVGDKQAIAKMYPGRKPPVDQLATALYYADTNHNLNAAAKNGVMQILADGVVIKEIQAGPQESRVEIKFDEYMKTQRTKVGYNFAPSAPDYSVSMYLTDDKFGYPLMAWCSPKYSCASGMSVKPFAAYITHFRNRNRGQDTPDAVIVQPVTPPTEDSYADLSGDIAVNGDLGPKLLNAILQRNSVEVRRLLVSGADPNASYQGWTALMLAAYTGEKEITRMLIVRKATFETKLANYWTAYLIARKVNNVDVMEILAKAGANVRTAGLEQRTLPALQ